MKKLTLVLLSLAVFAGNYARAMMTAEPPLHRAVLDNNETAVRKLISDGANVNARDEKGNTALMHAKTVAMAQILLDDGANPNVVNDDGNTALINAADRCNPGLVNLLLDRGADPAIQAGGKSAGMKATEAYLALKDAKNLTEEQKDHKNRCKVIAEKLEGLWPSRLEA